LVTIREVAHKAGVSIGTVSRVVNNKPGVSGKTRQHVLAVAQELGYVSPKRLPLSTSTITHLGLLTRPMGEPLTANPFYADVFHAVEQTCHEFQISLSFSTLDIVNGRLRSLPALVNDERISGIVLTGALSQEVVESLVVSAQLPVVLVDNCFPGCVWDSVMVDNTHGACLATEHLIAQGHRHIALIGGPDHPSIVERRAGYKKALQQHDLVPAVVTARELDISDGEWAVVELLRQAPETTAIVCSNDSQAIGALRKLQELGYKVPDDFSLVGFDDIQLAQVTSPSITTVRVDRQALGQLGAQLLLGRISAPDRPAIKTIVGVKLIERASACAPRTHNVVPPT
jgi:DNA-binding LacI/PurR family transcriptional regulator